MKAIKRIIAWICMKIFGKVRWYGFLVKVGNINKNSYYNLLTEIAMEKLLKPDSVCVDVGCSKGEILKLMMKHALRGRFFAFEPLPDHYANLVKNFPFERVKIYNMALCDSKGISTFNYVVSNPSYSGLKKRPYDRPNEEDCRIEVRTDLLDNVLKSASVSSVNLIKIDVEGAEYLVLKGAVDCIKANKPVIIFEHGQASAKTYGFTSNDLFSLLCNQLGLHIALIQEWLLGKPPLTQAQFCEQVDRKINYYFVAYG